MTAFGVLLTMRVKPGCAQRFEEVTQGVYEVVANNPGNLRQGIYRDIDDDRTYHITSEWVDEQAYLDHEQSTEHRRAIAPLAELREQHLMTMMNLVHQVGPETQPR